MRGDGHRADITDWLDKCEFPRGLESCPVGEGDPRSKQLWLELPGAGAEGLDKVGQEPDLPLGDFTGAGERVDNHLSPQRPPQT